MIAQESIERVKAEANIVEIVSETVPLKRAGMYYQGLCPFHSERSPSFFVKDSSNSYVCYGCGESGNVISFVMATRAMTFPDAIEYLASRTGIELKYDRGSKAAGPKVDREKLYACMHTAFLFFRRALTQTKGGTGEFQKVGEYLKKRALSADAINEFGIGYAPNQRGALLAALKANGFDDEVALTTGLVRRSASGELYELFRGRLIFPIFIDTKRIAAFGGRVIPGILDPVQEKQAPKYLNSPESPIYSKSRTIFGFPQAMDNIRTAGEVFVVEGYMDVVGLWMAGVRNVVACCGTAITDQHVKRFSGIVNRVLLLFDGDDAGRGAAGKAFPVARNADVDVTACFLPDGMDPDDFARTYPGRVREELSAVPRAQMIDVYLTRLFEKSGCAAGERPGPNLLGRMCEDVAKALAPVQKEVVRSTLITRAARRLGVDSEQLQRIVDAKRDAGAGSSTTEASIEARSASPRDVPSRDAASRDASPQRGAIGRPGRVDAGADRDPNEPLPTVSVSDLPKLDRDVLRAAMVLKLEILDGLMQNPEACSELQPDTVRFAAELSSALKDNVDDEEGQRTEAKRLLIRFGPSWVELWKEAYKMVEHGDVDMLDGYRQSLVALRRERLKRSVSEREREISLEPDENRKLELINELNRLRVRVRTLLSGDGSPQV